ncbi:hypothetical protein JHK82_048157 [Glycine max]|nr:hypothetical protein JHK86_048035 [Glycine max]KAG4944005.1 hypothetical protein JHK85_048651 [Glycine max]KAG5098303.1 hypothetical protein JHK82_048157 [Glycine max]KAG5103095.1 hypothetical protein JHK84_048064 [Glycine max]KAH1203280.1 hypothetical protein GmHk_17G049559 [Glycine max]
MKEHDEDVITNAVSGSAVRRTRSQAEPDWSVTESLILVNEVAAVEADCSVALSSYQQWNIIAENCAALDVPRSLPQCRRKWRALLNDYDGARGERRALPPGFEREVFEAVERVVRAREERGLVDPESDDEEDGNDEHDATVEIGCPDGLQQLLAWVTGSASRKAVMQGSKRKRQRSKSRHQVQKPKKFHEQRPDDSHEEGPEDDDNSEDEYLKDFLESRPKLKGTAERPPKHLVMPPKSLGEVELNENYHQIERPKPIGTERITISREENEETLSLKLQELAVEIEAIASESAADYKGGGSQNLEDSYDFTRGQGDKLIVSLGNFFNTLKCLCDTPQECK